VVCAYNCISIVMFKKNPSRPPMVVELRRLPNGYKVVPNEAMNLFQIKRVTRTMYRRKASLTQLISYKPPTWALNRRASPFPVPLYSRLHMSHCPLSLAGFASMPSTPSNENFSLNFSTKRQGRVFPLEGRTLNCTVTTGTQSWVCGGRT